MAQVTFDQVLEAVELLPADEQAELLAVVRRRLAERGWCRVVDGVREARAELAGGAARSSSVDDLILAVGSHDEVY